MQRSRPGESPEAYIDTLKGWRLETVVALRSAVTAVKALDESVKWGHLVFSANGPVCLIRAEPDRVLFGFWRGQLLSGIEPRLKAGGKYEMATLELKEGATITPIVARRLVQEAVALNQTLGDPTKANKPNRPKR